MTKQLFRALTSLKNEGPAKLAVDTWRYLTTQPKHSIRHLAYKLQYRPVPLRPYQTINIDPDSVNSILAPRFDAKLSKKGTYIRGGEWDRREAKKQLITTADKGVAKFDQRSKVSFDNFVLYTSCEQHFNEGIPWEDTGLYACYEPTNTTLEKRLSYLDELYEDIKTNGYKSKAILDDKSRTFDEVLVDVGRDGQFILDDGRHRMTLAKVLGLSEIPVRIFVRHKEWQQLRRDVAKYGTKALDNYPDVDPDHPDLRNI